MKMRELDGFSFPKAWAFLKRNPFIKFLLGMFMILGLFGILPSLILTWKTSAGWPNAFKVLGSLAELDTSHRWEQILAVSTVALTCATLILGLVGFCAFIGAMYHVERAERASRADLLLNIERQAMSPGMIVAQRELLDLFSAAWRAVKIGSQPAPHEQIIKSISKYCEKQLAEMREYQEEKYHVLFRNCEFFETVGIMVEQKYVDIEDIVSRFEVGIERVFACFDLHLKERRNEVWASELFFQHLSQLYDKVRTLREGRTA